MTVFSGEGPHNINDHVCTSAETTLAVVADTMTTIGHNNAGSVIRGDVLVAFGPEHAHTIASGGLSKRDVQQLLFERARNRVGLLKLRAMYKAGNWPDWVDADDDEALCPIVGQRRGHPHRGDRRAGQALRVRADLRHLEVGDAEDRTAEPLTTRPEPRTTVPARDGYFQGLI